MRGKASLIKLEGVLGRVAAEGIIPYPPGIICIAPGERWTQPLIDYLLAADAMAMQFPQFATHIQGVHEICNANGSVSWGVFVLE
ncbi:Orn/Lys/Arg family decarboxylase [Pseudomonas putida]